MVSLWPWKGEDTSPASFEKALSALATKLGKSQAQLNSLQLRNRRAKAIWTLYSSFAYLLCFIILFLVVGWRNWTAVEYTAVAGSPLIIWVIRVGITKYYAFRIDNVTQKLEAQQAERAKTIDKLKAATKYNSTQELLERYGGEKPKPKSKKESTNTPSKPQKNTQKVPPGRTNIGPPPPTANIVRSSQVPSQPSTPQQSQRSPLTYAVPSIAASPVGEAEFAPNAFSAPPQYAQSGEFNAGGHWYDRMLDLLLGEDEMLPKNRLALICESCRLVNGQAPPGTKSLSELGKWRCLGCGATNGENEAVKVVQEMKERIKNEQQPVSPSENKVEETGNASDGEHNVDAKEDEHDVEDGPEDSASDTIEIKPKGRPQGSRKKI